MRDDASTPRPNRQGRWLMMACTLGLVAMLLASQHQGHWTGAMSTGARSNASKGTASSAVQHRPARPRVDASAPTKGSPETPRQRSDRAQPEQATTERPVDVTPIATSPAPTTTTASGAASTSGFGPSEVSPTAAVTTSPLVFTGWLAGPTSVSASYPFDAGTGRTVTATWNGDASLTLEVACEGGIERHIGKSGVVASSSSGSCSVTLSGPADVATTSYAIAVQP